MVQVRRETPGGVISEEVFYASSSQIDVTVIRRLGLLPDSF